MTDLPPKAVLAVHISVTSTMCVTIAGLNPIITNSVIKAIMLYFKKSERSNLDLVELQIMSCLQVVKK